MNQKNSAMAYVTIMGNVNVGKSTLMSHLVDKTPDRQTGPTLAPTMRAVAKPYEYAYDTSHIPKTSSGEILRPDCMFIDLPGDPDKIAITKVYLRLVHGIVFVYDITNLASFRSLRDTWYELLEHHTTRNPLIIVVGNKLDLVESNPGARRVPVEVARDFAQQIKAVGFYEISALQWTISELNAIFDGFIMDISKKYKFKENIHLQSSGVSSSTKNSLLSRTVDGDDENNPLELTPCCSS